MSQNLRNSSSKRENNKKSSTTNNNNNYQSDVKLSTVYSSAVPKPKGFSYAHVWSGKPHTQQPHHQLDVSSPSSPSGTNKTNNNNLSPETRKRLVAERKEEMDCVRQELSPLLEIQDPSLVSKLGSLLEEEPRTNRAAQLQRQILQLLRADAKLRESILHPEPDEEDDGGDVGGGESDDDENAQNNNNGAVSPSSSVSTVSGKRKSRHHRRSSAASSSSSSNYSSSSSENSSGYDTSDSQEKSRKRREKKKKNQQPKDTRTVEEKQKEKVQQLLNEGKHVLKKDLRPRKPDAKQGSRTVFNPEINKGMRLNHGTPKLYQYRVMSLPWNKARAVEPKKLIEDDEDNEHEKKAAARNHQEDNEKKKKKKEQQEKFVVVDDASLESSYVKDLHYKQARAHRTKLEYHERLQRREIFGEMLRGFEAMRYSAKRQKEELILRNTNARGEVPSGSRPVSIRQKMYQTLLGEKRPFPASSSNNLK